MNNDETNEFPARIKKFWHPINIYNNLRKLYFTIIPKGSKAYNLTYGFLRIFLKQLHLFNIYYQEWIRRFDTLSYEAILEIREKINRMAEKPTISVVMPVYNPPPELFDQAIQSVLAQVYPYWELCIADDASTDPRIPALIHDYTQKDTRIRAILRKENGHISAASNSALELATNEFMALLDHDDVLHPLALLFVAEEINKHPDSVIIYSDEDKITKNGKRLDPYFKPDFNYELLLSQNMISHLGVYRTKIVRDVGGFRIGLEGSQDYDLVLRVLDHCEPDQIHHIPRPLYHWRISKESAARDINIKPYAIKAGTRALTEHLIHQSVKAKVNFLPKLAGYSISYSLPDSLPSVSIVIPAIEFSDAIINVVETILNNTDYPNFRIVLGLKKSSEKNIRTLSNDWQQNVIIHYYNNRSDIPFAKRVNQCVNATSSDFICLLNEWLTGFLPVWLRALIGQASQPGVGAVAPRLINANNRVFSNGIILIPDRIIQHLSKGEEQAVNGYFGWAKLTRGYSALSESCLLFKTEHFINVGGFNEDLKSSTYAGVDFCLKLKELDFRNILRPEVELYFQENHRYNQPLGIINQWEEADKIVLIEKWQKFIQNDPAFNPNLTIIDEGKILVNLSAHLGVPGD